MIKLFSEIPHLESERLELRALTTKDAPALIELSHNERVYRYLPTFLYERKYDDVYRVIDGLYGECFAESIILGIFLKETGRFCGLSEMYGFRDPIHKISVGYRLLEAWWGRGIATEALGLMVNYLFGQTDIEIITASTMVENRASAHVLEKNGFSLVVAGAREDWGYPQPTMADKWIR